MKATTTALAALATSACLVGSTVAAPPHLPDAPAIWPTPQQQTLRADGFKLPSEAALIADDKTDRYALRVVQDALKEAGVSCLVTADPDSKPDAALRVYVGGPSENNATATALAALGLQGPDDLPADGYVLGIGRHGHKQLVALSGHDARGTFYAAQSLRQLVVQHHSGSALPGVEIRDWPSTSIRGSIEVFYGTPWSTEERLDQLSFYGETKQNTYIYSPKDDPYLRDEWRDLYPEEDLAVFEQLTQRARENHVDFTYALSPGLDVCYSSKQDEKVLIAKFQSMWDVGVEAFNLPFDDIEYEWYCPEDEERWGKSSDETAGYAQAYLVNKVLYDFIDTHEGAARLQIVVTEYRNTTETPYRAALREALDPRVVVFWSGPITVAPNITALDVQQAEEVFGHDILIGDNFPVNDYVYQRILLGPYAGREPNLTEQAVGITLNPSPQSQASKIGLFEGGDFCWNSGAYDADATWLAAVKYLGGSAWEALKVFAENNFSSVMEERESLVLSPLIEQYWTFYSSTSSNRKVDQHARALSKYFAQMASTPQELARELNNPTFMNQTEPWLNKLGMYGKAGQVAVDALSAQRAGRGEEAQKQRQALLDLRVQLDNMSAIACPLNDCRTFNPVVAPGVMEPFLNRTLEVVSSR